MGMTRSSSVSPPTTQGDVVVAAVLPGHGGVLLCGEVCSR